MGKRSIGKVSACVLALALSLTLTAMLSVLAFAEEGSGNSAGSAGETVRSQPEAIYTGVWGTCPWEISEDGVLAVHPGTGETYPNWSPWFDYSSSVKHIVFLEENGSKVIAPTDCSKLFYGMADVATIDLSGLDTSQAISMYLMFYNCSSLASLDLSSLDTSSVTNMIGMFDSCQMLTSLDLSPLDTSSVTEMDLMFRGCSSLTSLDLTCLDTSRVTGMGAMFSSCSSLASVDLSGLDTSKVTTMNDLFYNCSSLASLDLSSLDTSSVTRMDYAFSECLSLSFVSVGEATSLVKELPSYEVKGHKDWYSLESGTWYTAAEIQESRVCIADTYTKFPEAGTDIANATILGYASAYYMGKPITYPNLRVRIGKTDLVEGVDYVVSYEDNDKPGRATITVTGIGAFTGERKVHFTIWQTGDAGQDNIVKTPVTFGVSFPLDGESWTPMEIDWGYDLFDKRSTVSSSFASAYDNRLAVAAAAIAESAYDEGLAYKVFGELGVRDVFTSDNYGEHLANQPAFCMGYTQASIGGATKNLYVVAVRGTHDFADWETNAGSVMQAFEPSANYMKNRFDSFVEAVAQECPSSADFENVVFLTGHSLGGAVAGRLAEFLSGDSRFPADSTFCYTFAAPNWTYSHTDDYYQNIRNIVSDDDVVTTQQISAPCRNGLDYRFKPSETPGFKDAFEVVTKGQSYERLSMGNIFTTGQAVTESNRIQRLKAKHLMDAYMACLLCRSEADELWTYKVGYAKKLSVRCPVDVELIDFDGAVAAKVVDNEVVVSTLGVEVAVEDNQKFFYLLDGEPYTVNLVGSDSGSMTLTLEEVELESRTVVESKCYSNVVLEKGKRMMFETSGIDDIDATTLFVVEESGEPAAEVMPDGSEMPIDSEPPKKSLDDARVSLPNSSFTYTGKAITPSPRVTVGSFVLRNGLDYTLSYKNNTAAGIASVTATGKGGYEGAATATFKIKRASNKATAAKTKVKKTFQAKAFKKKAATVSLPKVTTDFGKAKWKVTAKDKKKVLSLKSGKVQVKKGAKKGKYTLKLKATVAGAENYKGASSKVVTVKVTVK